MRATGVARYDVEQDADVSSVRFSQERIEVRERAELGIDVPVFANVVAEIAVRRRHDRVQPQVRDSQPFEVIEPADDARQIADAVVVGILP